MPSDLQHCVACVTDMRKAYHNLAPRNDQQRDAATAEVERYANELVAYDTQPVRDACTRAARECKRPPSLAELIELAGEAQKAWDQLYGTPQPPAVPSAPPNRNQSLATFLGLLPSCMLREMDRMLPDQKRRFLNAAADHFVDHWADSLKATGEQRKAFMGMARDFFEQHTGKSFNMIMHEEEAARGPDFRSIGGANTIGALAKAFVP